MLRTLRGKISLIYMCLVFVIAVVGAVSAYNLYRLEKSIDGLMVDNYRSIGAVSNMLEAIERQDSAILVYINADRQRGISLFSDNSRVFQNWFDIESGNITEKGERGYVDSIDADYASYLEMFSQLQEIRDNEGAKKALEFYDSNIATVFSSIKRELKSISQLNEKAMFLGKDNATDNARRSMYIISILSLAAAAGGYLLSRFFANRFLKPVMTLTQTVKQVKAGDLNQHINIGTHDEIGEFAQEFNNMTHRLQQYEQSTLGNLMLEKNKSVAIVKSISDPLIVLDTNYKIILMNNACERFFGIVEEKVVNKHFLEAIRNGEVYDQISSVLHKYQDR